MRCKVFFLGMLVMLPVALIGVMTALCACSDS